MIDHCDTHCSSEDLQLSMHPDVLRQNGPLYNYCWQRQLHLQQDIQRILTGTDDSDTNALWFHTYFSGIEKILKKFTPVFHHHEDVYLSLGFAPDRKLYCTWGEWGLDNITLPAMHENSLLTVTAFQWQLSGVGRSIVLDAPWGGIDSEHIQIQMFKMESDGHMSPLNIQLFLANRDDAVVLRDYEVPYPPLR